MPVEFSLSSDAAADQVEFDKLAEEWRLERGPFSSARRLAKHPAYQRIIAMGWSAVPMILKKLQESPDHWFVALHAITGENPVSAGSRGNLEKMSAAWVKWGHEKGVI